MISFLRGILLFTDKGTVVVENNGLGFEVNVPESFLADMPSAGNEITLYTYMSVKEDDISLFGFKSRDQLALFKQLISVSGIGPKCALGILSTFDCDALKLAIISGDAKLISKAPLVGLKTAQKLILELKDKIQLTVPSGDNISSDIIGGNDSGSEVVEALIALGYSNSEAVRAVSSIPNAGELTSDELLKLALKKLF